MKRTISNSDDVIDSRDVTTRIEELEDELEGLTSEEDAATASLEEEWSELQALKSLAEEGEGSPDWHHGETLIRESYFEDYAKQLAEDVGAINEDASWPNNCIDWERAAEELKVDYFEVDYDGVTYLIRA